MVYNISTISNSHFLGRRGRGSILFFGAVLIGVVLVAVGYSFLPGGAGGNPSDRMRQIEREKDDKKQQAAMKHLALDVGPEESIALLARSAIPKGGPAHLLAHKIGEAAYEQYGLDALVHCQNDMLNGCTHGLILSATLDGGFERVRELVSACRKYSDFQYHMCLHGAGHAFLTLSGYRVGPALANCDSLGESAVQSQIHCYNGVFMENALGEHEGLIPPLHPDLSTKNFMKPCDTVEPKYKQACYFNQPSWWAWTQGNNMQKIALECSAVPVSFQDECADGFGRVLLTVAGGDVSEIARGCALLGDAMSAQCMGAVSKAQFGVGNREASFDLCAALSEDKKQDCYVGLVRLVKEFSLPADEFVRLCRRIEPALQSVCEM